MVRRAAAAVALAFALPAPALAAGPPCDTVAGNLVQNCGFESPAVGAGSFAYFPPGSDVSGWQVQPGDGVDLVHRDFFGAFPVNNGSQSLDLNHDRQGSVAQRVPTAAGQVYRVTVQLSGYPAASANCPATQPQVLRVSAGGASQSFSFTPGAAPPPGAQRFEAATFDFEAGGAGTSLALAGVNDGCAGPVVDDVTVVATSQPVPAVGRSVAARPVSGTVRVRPPGARAFQQLRIGTSLPVGTVIDARGGRVRITATSGGASYSADFYAGTFQIAQRRRNGATADIRLFGGSFRRCPPGLRSAASRRVRRLWGDGNGRFRTIGRFSSATIRGTTWLTEDRCDATLTRVAAGSVTVRDFDRRRTVVVRAGRSYLAQARRGASRPG